MQEEGGGEIQQSGSGRIRRSAVAVVILLWGSCTEQVSDDNNQTTATNEQCDDLDYGRDVGARRRLIGGKNDREKRRHVKTR